MNAYKELQSSGICWPDLTGAGLYQPFQAALRWPEPVSELHSLRGLENQMAEFAAEHASLDEVRRNFVLADSSVSTFLSGHRTIPQILLASVVHLRACFGAGAVFKIRTPIDESGSQTLYVVAMWPGDVREVRQALARFDDAWWIAHSSQASGYVSFTYELV